MGSRHHHISIRRKQKRRRTIRLLLITFGTCFIVAVILNFYVLKPNRDRINYETEDVKYIGSDVRKESWNRKMYEKKYRETHTGDWDENYKKILDNIEESNTKEYLEKFAKEKRELPEARKTPKSDRNKKN